MLRKKKNETTDIFMDINKYQTNQRPKGASFQKISISTALFILKSK